MIDLKPLTDSTRSVTDGVGVVMGVATDGAFTSAGAVINKDLINLL